MRTEGVLGRGRFLDNGEVPLRARLRTTGRAVVPSSRALVGALLLAVSGVVTFATWQSAAGDDGVPYVVADEPLPPGSRLTVEDLRLVRLDLPPALAGRAFLDVEEVVGRSTFGPVGEGELLQTGQVSDVGDAARPVEVAFALPRDRVLDGRVRSGDRVDVFSSDDQGTTQIVADSQVVAVDDAGGTSFDAGGEVTITLGLDDPADRVPLIHAVRKADVTLTSSASERRGGG